MKIFRLANEALNLKEVLMLNSKALLHQHDTSEAMTGKVLRHKDGSLTITRGKALAQYFRQN